MNAVELSLFSHRISAICDEMGAVLQRAAFSPNIRDRLDFSCAIFDARGRLCAQAAHIPVHLGSMAFAMRDLAQHHRWQSGDLLVVNDPFLGGTHLPDITLISPLFLDDELVGFIANRAHHADIGASSPGSMPLSKHIDEEGMRISPSLLVQAGERDDALWQKLITHARSPAQAEGDYLAQIGAIKIGVARLQSLVTQMSSERFESGIAALNEYGRSLAQVVVSDIPVGQYGFVDYLDDDGFDQQDLPIQLTIFNDGARLRFDFSGTAGQVPGNINCPLSVTAAAVFYVFRCLLPKHAPACAGLFDLIEIDAPLGCLVNAVAPAAVAAGNVETSSRLVDVVMGALLKALPDRLAAASQGTMNNLAMGGSAPHTVWDYYETLAGGGGASVKSAGQDARHSHMTNTLNTPIEVMESQYPLRVRAYRLREGSGGSGKFAGGAGIERVYEFLEPATVTLLTERRRLGPWGFGEVEPHGNDGAVGENCLNGERLPGKVALDVEAGDILSIATPGGGGWG